MEITGKLIDVLEPVNGKSSRGEWKKQEFILETNEQYPKKVCIANWNDKIDLNSLQKGQEITASVNVESREFKGRWYTDIKVWRIQNNANTGNTPTPPPPDFPDVQEEPDYLNLDDDNGEGALPF